MTSEEFEQRFQKIYNQTLDIVDNKENVEKVLNSYGVKKGDDPVRVAMIMGRAYTDTLVHNLLKEFLVDGDEQHQE
ncbi:hypothetical protein [uncultured Limosilactobacillus sp.]|uniref:hypothetical protein n=1 Tax=uncultured Limosilactobacillus sp. TaxID=2837629 RepID=UPI0025EA432E|nr:hypothetical protein [uncultured Limosilactobacillus sp.]